jgi:hypothetical protein
MRGHRGVSRLTLAAALGLTASLPFLLGQGCGGDGVVEPVKGGLYDDTQAGLGGNVAPSFRFTAPVGDVQAEIGDTILMSWTDSDPDNDAQITILFDPDTVPNNGNEIPILTGISEDDLANTVSCNTGLYGLSTGSYRIVARITDGVNPEVLVAATGQLNLFPPGTSDGNSSPVVTIAEPVTNLSVTHGSEVNINYCGNDRDGGEGGITADVIIMLDQDTNPFNDLLTAIDTSTSQGAADLLQLCSGTLPVEVGGAVILGCAKDDKCTDAAVGTDFLLTVDAARIPQTPGGEPYQIRVSMWDHTNPPVHAYGPGTLNLATLATGSVDVGKVGRGISGARFIGFDTGGRAGFTGTPLGDFDSPADNAEDFVVVARFGRPFERGNIGSGFLIYGMNGQRYGSDIYLNSYGTQYRGCCFASGHTGPYYKYPYAFSGDPTNTAEPYTEGITAVTSIEDMNGDGKPEILFGLPYAESWYDNHDDDPCDKEDLCYFDGLPNPYSTPSPAGNDDITAWDYRETPTCVSTDGDWLYSTPLNQGFIVYVSSTNRMENTVIDLSQAGQKDPGPIVLDEGTSVSGASAPDGARLRGSYYSLTADFTGISLDPYNDFGRTLGTMPDLSNGGTIPEKDGASEYLISMPKSYDGRGEILLMWGGDLGTWCAQGVQSIPDYEKVGDCSRVIVYPDYREIIGATPGDQFGYGTRAGDINGDGHQDILCGSPGSSNGAIDEAGTVYIIYGRLDFGHIDLGLATDPENPNRQYVPRVEIHGTIKGDRFGETQALMGDLNGDGFGDIAFASKIADGPGGADSGMIGLVFGGRYLTGEQSFSVNQVGTTQLPGCVFYGAQRGGHAGHVISNIGDFNGDSFDELLISAPDEVHVVNGQNRRGAAYLIFGGPHLRNTPSTNWFSLSQVGSPQLPGIVFISPYTQGTADEATIDWAGGAGDVDGDGFKDIVLGLSEADFVNPLEPSQRRVDAGEVYLIYGNNSGTNTIGQ